MAKTLADSVLDAGLDVIATSTEQYLCTSAPTDRATAISTSLIPVATPGFQAVADGTPNGRSLVCDASNGNTADDDGTATHVALCTGSALLLVTSLASNVAITNGMQINIGSFTTNFADPV
jgi:hypothetical protein